MITEKDLREAIAECEGQRHPNANTCLKLAAYYTILNQMVEPTVRYSYADAPTTRIEGAKNDFTALLEGKNPKDVWGLVKELTDTIAVIEPKLYKAIIRKAKELP